jgi:hypothetical protein
MDMQIRGWDAWEDRETQGCGDAREREKEGTAKRSDRQFMSSH